MEPLRLSVLSLSSLILINFPFLAHFFSVGATSAQRIKQNSGNNKLLSEIDIYFLCSPTFTIDETIVVSVSLPHHTIQIFLVHPSFHHLPQLIGRQKTVIVFIKSSEVKIILIKCNNY